jgi:Flp pilus assembly pilin Flp
MQSRQSDHRLRAQGLVEFGLLLALVAVVAVAGLLVFGNTVSSLMSTLSHTVSSNLTVV